MNLRSATFLASYVWNQGARTIERDLEPSWLKLQLEKLILTGKPIYKASLPKSKNQYVLIWKHPRTSQASTQWRGAVSCWLSCAVGVSLSCKQHWTCGSVENPAGCLQNLYAPQWGRSVAKSWFPSVYAMHSLFWIVVSWLSCGNFLPLLSLKTY